MEKTLDKPVETKKSLDDFRAENMAYASQSVFINLLANAYEPLLNNYIQKRHAQANPEFYNRPVNERYGNLKHNYIGEFVGDVGGSATLFVASSLAPGLTQGFIDFAGKMVHPIYHTLGHAAFKDEFNEPYYAAKVDKWSQFQERNFARSVIVAAGNIASNVAAQKVLKNPSPWQVIAKGKTLTTGLTNMAALGARIYAPQRMKELDQKLGKKYFTSEDEKEFEAAKQAEQPQPTQTGVLTQRPTSFAQGLTPRFHSHVDRLRYTSIADQSVLPGSRFS